MCYLSLLVFFRFQPQECDGCHGMTQILMSFTDPAIVTAKGHDYRIIVEMSNNIID